jgi:predicted nucleic acid-binding protein
MLDINDEDYVALALHLDCPRWTGDKKLAKALNGSGVRCLTTADVRSR